MLAVWQAFLISLCWSNMKKYYDDENGKSRISTGCSFWGITKSFFFISCLLFVGTAYAQVSNQQDSLEQYRQLLIEQEKKLEQQRRALGEQTKELERLKKQFEQLSGQPASQPPSTSTKENKPKTAATQAPSGPVGQAPPKPTEPERPPEMPRLSETVGGVLTKKGKYVLEPSLSYAFSDNNRVFIDAFTFLPAIVIGLTDIRQVKRHSFFASLGLRYGLTNRLEVEARVPYSYRADIQRARPISTGAAVDQTFNADGHNLGDIEFAARYQLTNGSGGWPILVGNMLATVPTGKSPFRLKTTEVIVPDPTGDNRELLFNFPLEVPTGSGFFTFQPSITALYPTAPAVFFGSLSYTYTMSTKEDIGKIDAGDGVGMTFGMGFTVNDRTSFNLGYSHQHFFNTKVSGRNIGGSALDIGQFLLGYSFRYSNKTNINLSVGIGTTDNAQDARLNLRVPMTF